EPGAERQNRRSRHDRPGQRAQPDLVDAGDDLEAHAKGGPLPGPELGPPGPLLDHLGVSLRNRRPRRPAFTASSSFSGLGAGLGRGLDRRLALRLGLATALGSRRLGLLLLQLDRGGHLGAPLADPAFLADLLAQVVEARLANVAVAEHLDPVDARRVDHEGPLHPHPVRHPPDREVPAQAPPGDADDQALEDLNPFPGSLHHLGVDPDRVARAKLRHRLLELLPLDLLDDVHFLFNSPSCRSALGAPARASVRCRAWARRQASICWWLPESSTSGTRRPRYSAGRVYCGWPSWSVTKESPSSDSSAPRTPGTRRATASMTTIAASSPPLKT